MSGLEKAFWLLLTMSLSTVDVERLHGSGSAMRRAHPMYGWCMFLARVYLLHTRILLLPDRDRRRERLFRALQRAREQQPSKTNYASIFMADRMHSELGLLSSEATGPQRRECINTTLKSQKEDWEDLPIVLQRDYIHVAAQTSAQGLREQKEDVLHLEAALALYDERAAKEKEYKVHHLNGGTFAFSPEGLRLLQTKFDTSDSTTFGGLKDRIDNLAEAVPYFDKLDELNRVRQRLDPLPSVYKPANWVRQVCRHHEAFLHCALELRHSPFDVEWYAVQIPLLSPQSLCLQPIKLENFDVSGILLLLLHGVIMVCFHFV